MNRFTSTYHRVGILFRLAVASIDRIVPLARSSLQPSLNALQFRFVARGFVRPIIRLKGLFRACFSLLVLDLIGSNGLSREHSRPLGLITQEAPKGVTHLHLIGV
jgi:hypothetical protein